MNRLLARTIDYLSPLPCLECGTQGELICAACLPQAVVTKAETCWRCNRLSPAGRTCITCRSHSRLAAVTVVSHYEGNIKELVLRLKFHSYRAAATLAARLIVSRLDASQFDIVTSVPTTAARRRQRGYNQAELIAREIALYVDLPYVPLLGRRGQVRQMGATRTDRLKQLAGSFYSVRDCAGLRVLVIDDVLTTGATLSECAAELKAAGAKRVWGAVLAKH